MELRQVIGNRRSIRFLLPHKPVELEKVQCMLEAAGLDDAAAESVGGAVLRAHAE